MKLFAKHFSAICLLAYLAGCAANVPSEKLTLTQAEFSDLNNWEQDDHEAARKAFRNSCSKPSNNNAEIEISRDTWRKICHTSEENIPAKEFFEQNFTPYSISNGTKTDGLFTGYYIPILQGSEHRTKRFTYPVYAQPRTSTFPSREQIDTGALNGKNLELVWVDDKIMLFFMHIQGSGFVQLQNGETIRLSFAGKNNFPYVPIGKILVKNGELAKENVSLTTIRNWLREHPAQADELMWQNPSYVFFKHDRVKTHVVGAQGVPLTAKRSLAVDAKYLPYGLPVFLETSLPAGDSCCETEFNHLMIAQDTGGAIRGVIRGDIFFGTGEAAEKLAGNMQGRGKFFALVPKDVTP